jgi:hypothetical protein
MAREQLFSTRVQDKGVDAIILFLRELFKEHPTLTYSDDIRASKLRITDIYSLRVEDPEKFPVLAVRRLRHTWTKRIIGRLKELSWKTGSHTQMDFISGGAVVQCISALGLEAEQLAQTVFNSIIMFKKDFAGNGIMLIETAEMGEEQPIVVTSEIETVMVPVTVGYLYPVEWTITNSVSSAFANFTITGHISDSYGETSEVIITDPI